MKSAGIPRKPASAGKELRARLEHAEATLSAIHRGEVDAVLVAGEGGDSLLTLKGADVYRTLVEDMSEGALTVSKGVIVYANRFLADLIRMPLEQVIGAALQKWVAPESQPVLQALLAQGETGKSRGEIDLVASDGARVPVHVSVSQLLSQGAPDVFCLVATDLTLVKQRQQLEQLQASLNETMRAIAGIVEMRDPYTAGHQARVADLASAIATRMALPDDQIHAVFLAGTVHDLGKIQIPAEILSKPGKLNDAEFGLIKGHSQAGYDILKGISFPWPIAQIVRQHHERLDGSGYPLGISGESILLEARILSVADVIEAMASHRPYRPGLGIDFALAEISRLRGRHFDPEVVDACIAVFREQGYVLKV